MPSPASSDSKSKSSTPTGGGEETTKDDWTKSVGNVEELGWNSLPPRTGVENTTDDTVDVQPIIDSMVNVDLQAGSTTETTPTPEGEEENNENDDSTSTEGEEEVDHHASLTMGRKKQMRNITAEWGLFEPPQGGQRRQYEESEGDFAYGARSGGGYRGGRGGGGGGGYMANRRSEQYWDTNNEQALRARGGKQPTAATTSGGAMSPGVLAAALAQQPQYSLARPAPYVTPYANMNGYDRRQRRDSVESPSQLSTTNLYIKGLKKETTDQDLQNMCSVFGTITSTKAIMDKATNTCKGYGFVDFETADAADAAAKSLNGQGLHAQMAKIRTQHTPADVPSVEQDPTNLYIANLPQSYTDTDLSDMLASYGLVISTRILRTPDGSSRGVGFARMESKEKCEEIIANLHNQPPPGHNGPPLQVKFADSGKKPRRNQLSHGALEPFIAGMQVPSDLSSLVGLAGTMGAPNLQQGVFAGGSAAYQARVQGFPYAYMPQTMPMSGGQYAAQATALMQNTQHPQAFAQYTPTEQMTIDTGNLQQQLMQQQYGMQQQQQAIPYMYGGQAYMQPTHYLMQQPDPLQQMMHSQQNGGQTYDPSAVLNGQAVDYGTQATTQYMAQQPQSTPLTNAAAVRTNGTK